MVVPAMLLAAGRGERMRPLTDTVPKPLLQVHGETLAGWQLRGLAAAGFRQVVANHAWLGDQLVAHLGDGSRHGVQLSWSAEVSALGTAGGVVQALTLLASPLFVVVSGDILTDFDYRRLWPAVERLAAARADGDCAHLVLVDDHRMKQDFSLAPDGRVIATDQPSLTYGNIGVFRRSLFDGLHPGEPADLGERLRAAVAAGRVTGEFHAGVWNNVGTPADLARLNAAPLPANLPAPARVC